MLIVKLEYPPLKRRLKLGFVGGGRGALVGEWHAMGVRMSNRWDVVAGALSSKPDVAQASGRDWLLADERIYDDYRKMAAEEGQRDDGIDAVAICTPNGSHADIAEHFMDAGIHIICDKPMTAAWDDAERLVKKAKDSGLYFGVTYTYSFHSMVRQARAMVESGMLGTIRQAHVEYVQEWAAGKADPVTKQSSWRRDADHAGRGSATGDIGTHAFHLLHFVSLQKITELSARFHVCGGAAQMEDTAFMQLTLENGAPGTLWCTQAAPGNTCGLRLRLYGDQGGLEWDQENPEYLHFTPIGEPTRTLHRGHGAGILPDVERLVRLPRGHAEGVPDAWCNLYTEAAIDIEALQDGTDLTQGTTLVPDVMDGARGVYFVEQAANSAEQNGAWLPCWYEQT